MHVKTFRPTKKLNSLFVCLANGREYAHLSSILAQAVFNWLILIRNALTMILTMYYGTQQKATIFLFMDVIKVVPMNPLTGLFGAPASEEKW